MKRVAFLTLLDIEFSISKISDVQMKEYVGKNKEEIGIGKIRADGIGDVYGVMNLNLSHAQKTCCRLLTCQ